MRIHGCVVALLAGIAGLSVVLQAEEPWAGVWKFSTAKSSPFPNPPQSQIFTMKEEDGLAVVMEDNVTAKGEKYQVNFRMAFDGKDYPLTGSRAGIELVSAKRVNVNSAEIKVKKKDGTVLATYWQVISADGKTRIRLTWFGAEMSGPPARVAIDDRQ